MFSQLNKLNMVDAAELKAYINRIVDDMDKAQLAAMEKAPLGYAAKIRDKIETLLEAHYRETFDKWLETERIVCMPSFRLPTSIHPASNTAIYARSLYTAEDGDMNKLEQKLIVELTALPNVRWWHRNIARQGFAINGFIKHYPDILIMTQSGKLICAETKGEHLKNDDSREKIALGQAWRTAAGKDFRYYMVFENEENLLPGAMSMSQFIETVVLLSRETNPLTVEVRMEVETGEVKEHPTYKRIQEYVQEKYGFKVHTAYIAEVKRMVGLDMHKAPNAVEQKKHEYHPCPPEKVEAIKDALRHFGLISE